MIQKPFDQITKADLDVLVTDEVGEGRTLEYKRELPGNSDKDKREFLADVSSFANASGGDIVYGVEEKLDADGKNTGLPGAVVGLRDVNTDQTLQRLENMIRDGLDPRITGVRISTCDGFRDGPVVLIRIPRSFAAPHMVAYKQHSRFYSRNSAGKYALDVHELRSAFLLSESLTDRIRSFRAERLSRIVAEETPVLLAATAKMVLHLIPVAAFSGTDGLDVRRHFDSIKRMPPMGDTNWDFRYNFDGVITFSGGRNGPEHRAYLQVFRNGAIEAVNTSALRGRGEEKYIPGVAYERYVLNALGTYLGFLRKTDIPPPIVVSLAMLGVSGYTMHAGQMKNWFHDAADHPIGQDALVFPETIVDEYGCRPSEFMRPTFDAVWQSCGFERSFNYDADGVWSENRCS